MYIYSFVVSAKVEMARYQLWSSLLTYKMATDTVKRLIIGDYLFGEIGGFFKFAKISCHQIETLQSLDITSVGNHQINSLPNCQIWKTAKYNSRQIFSFYSIHFAIKIAKLHIDRKWWPIIMKVFLGARRVIFWQCWNQFQLYLIPLLPDASC